jgi:hypothetical protein
MVQEHNYNLACANTDVVYGIGLYRIGLDRTLQLGRCLLAALPAARARRPAFWNAVISINDFLCHLFIYPRALRSLPVSPLVGLSGLSAPVSPVSLVSPGLSVRSLGSVFLPRALYICYQSGG